MPGRRQHLNVGIVTTAARTELLHATQASLDDPDVTVHTDLAPTAVRNHLAAWGQVFHDPRTTHGLLLHDDLLAARNWRTAAHTYITRFPRQYAISLYSPRKIAMSTEARTYGHAFISARDWLNEQALLLHRDVWRGYTQWLAHGEHEPLLAPLQRRHHDVLLSTFLASRGVRVMLAAPPVFQHVGQESTMGHRWKTFGKPRQVIDWPGPYWDAAAHTETNLHPRNTALHAYLDRAKV